MGCYPTQLFMNLRAGPAGANSSWKHRTPNIQWPGWRIGRWMLDVFLASPLVDGFYKNQIDDFRPAAGGGAAKILRKARWMGRNPQKVAAEVREPEALRKQNAHGAHADEQGAFQPHARHRENEGGIAEP